MLSVSEKTTKIEARNDDDAEKRSLETKQVSNDTKKSKGKENRESI